MVWSSGILDDLQNPVTSTVFPNVITTEPVPMELDDGKLMFSYSHSPSNGFLTMRLIPDQDSDLIPDIHDDLPAVPNQWEDSDLDGYGDNAHGALPDSCVSTLGISSLGEYGCGDFDLDGWSNAIDDCSNDKGTSWWGRIGCYDIDQDGWADNDPTFVAGDRFPQNWKQAIDSDGDEIGDNHGPD